MELITKSIREILESILAKAQIEESISEQFLDAFFLFKDGNSGSGNVIDHPKLHNVFSYCCINFDNFKNYRFLFSDIPSYQPVFDCMDAISNEQLFDDISFNYKDARRNSHNHTTNFPVLCSLSLVPPKDGVSSIFDIFRILVFCDLFIEVRFPQHSMSQALSFMRLARVIAKVNAFEFFNDMNQIYIAESQNVDSVGETNISLKPSFMRMASLLEKSEGKYKINQLSSVTAYLNLIIKGDEIHGARKIRTYQPVSVTHRRTFETVETVEGIEQPSVVWDSECLEHNELNPFINDDAGARGEMQASKRYIKPALTTKQRKNTSIKQTVFQLQGLRNSEIKSNQNLLLQENQLRRYEVDVLLKELIDKTNVIFEKCKDSEVITKTEELEIDTLVMIYVILIFGASFEQATQVKRINKGTNLDGLLGKQVNGVAEFYISFFAPKHQLHTRKYKAIESLTWNNKTEIETNKDTQNDTKVKMENSNELNDKVNKVAIQLNGRLLEIGKTLFMLKRKMKLEPNKPILDDPEDKVLKKVRKLLKSINRRNNTEMTLSKIESWLAKSIEQETGDSALSFYLLNKAENTKPPEAYYTAFDPALFDQVHQFLFSKDYFDEKPFVENKSKLSVVVGSKLYMKLSILKDASTYLLKRLNSYETITLLDKIKFHNEMVNYIFIMFTFGAGLRSVCDPLESVNSFDFKTGLFVLNEKQSRSETNYRYFFLPNILFEQIKAYQSHLNVLADSVAGARFELSCVIRAALTGKKYRESIVPFLFYIREKEFNRKSKKTSNYIQSLKPQIITQSLSNIFPIPLNMGRHFLSSELRARGCSAHWIKAFMGHAKPGQEFDSANSSMSLSSLLQLRDQFLDPIMKDIEWKVSYGLAANIREKNDN